jgi:hypothetical protein
MALDAGAQQADPEIITWGCDEMRDIGVYISCVFIKFQYNFFQLSYQLPIPTRASLTPLYL